MLLLKVMADGANMGESGFKVDHPSFVQSLKDPKQPLTSEHFF